MSPTGPHAVGTVSCVAVDGTRPARLDADRAGRHLRLKLWYPADPSPGLRAELLWDSLRTRHDLPLPMRLLVKRMKTRSASLPDAPFAANASAAATILYHPGFVSFAAENTSLMEELASRGHVVIAIEHAEQLAELQSLSRAQPAAEKRRARQLERRMRDARQRARVVRSYYEASTTTNRIVLERARDNAFVLDRLPAVLAAIPGRPATAAEPVRVAGFSLGGAVALTAAHGDARVSAAVNIDGGTQGLIDASGVTVPCLMIYSARNDRGNDPLLPSHAMRETAAAGSRHLNLHDAAALWPRALRWMGATGSCDPRQVLRWRNQRVAEFCSIR